MNKKILFGMLVIGLIATLAGAGMYAYFNDTETSTGTFQAGTIDLAVNDENPWSSSLFPFPFKDVKPCEELTEFKINITNVGNNPGILTMEISYTENDKEEYDSDATFEFSAARDSKWEMIADDFARLVYIKALYYQYQCPADDYYGSKHDDLPDMVTAMDANGDGLVSVYEYKAFGIVPYDPTGAPFPATASVCYFITLHLGDAFIEGTDYHIDTTGTAWNVPQADGIDITFTATLKQVP